MTFWSTVSSLPSASQSDPFLCHYTHYHSCLCLSNNVIYCISWSPCPLLYIDQTGCCMADRLAEHLQDAKPGNYTSASSQFCSTGHSLQHLSVFGLSLYRGHLESYLRREQVLIFSPRHFVRYGFKCYFSSSDNNPR